MISAVARFCLMYLIHSSTTLQAPHAPENHPEMTEYCQWETFNATCDPDHVVLMTSARYGRMFFGRCMKEDHGSSGCSADVLHLLDQKCSGRRSCQLPIPDATLHNSHSCPKELMPFLEASYSCVPVKSGTAQACALFGGQPVPSESGYVASLTLTENGVGTSTCPWMIDVQSGHRINLTLFSFADNSSPTKSAQKIATKSNYFNCPWTVVVKEGNLTAQLPGCTAPGASRDRLVYSSHGSSIQVYLVETKQTSGEVPRAVTPILLRYQVFGCADMGPLPDVLIKRYGDTTLIKCNSNAQTFIMTCTDNVWKGDIANCSKASAIESGHRDQRLHGGIPYGLLLVIGIGVLMGLAVGVFLLFVILICLRQYKEKRLRSLTTDPLFQGVEFDDVTSGVYVERRVDTSPVHHGLCPYHNQLRYQWPAVDDPGVDPTSHPSGLHSPSCTSISTRFSNVQRNDDAWDTHEMMTSPQTTSRHGNESTTPSSLRRCQDNDRIVEQTVLMVTRHGSLGNGKESAASPTGILDLIRSYQTSTSASAIDGSSTGPKQLCALQTIAECKLEK